jgi:hypothetical protein
LPQTRHVWQRTALSTKRLGSLRAGLAAAETAAGLLAVGGSAIALCAWSIGATANEKRSVVGSGVKMRRTAPSRTFRRRWVWPTPQGHRTGSGDAKLVRRSRYETGKCMSVAERQVGGSGVASGLLGRLSQEGRIRDDRGRPRGDRIWSAWLMQ